MRPRTKCVRLLAGLVALAATLSGGIEAYAAGSVLKITGGYKPGTGDPPYDYIFQVFLEPPTIPPGGNNFIASGDFFSISGLPGVTSGSLTLEPGVGPGVIWQPTPSTDSIEWTFFGNQNYVATTTEVPIGQFIVETTEDFTTVPLPDKTTINYFFSYDGGTATGTGQFAIRNLSIPEPSSIVMLSAGAGVLSMIVIRRRRRQHQNLQPAA
jgi:hypothetical protein